MMMTMSHKASLQTLTFVITLVTLWVSNDSLAVQALCPSPHQTTSSSFQTRFHAVTGHRSHNLPSCKAAANDHERTTDENPLPHRQPVPRTKPTERKSFLRTLTQTLLVTASGAILPNPRANAAPPTSKPSLPTTLARVREARAQMEPIPSLIQTEKWDAVRAILVTPPLSDCWMKTSRPLLQDYAAALGDDPAGAVNGDDAEFDALGFKEEALDHLRFLDMSAYNNVFNPIKAEGESGASKELVRSYYEDPTKEFKASVAAIDGLIKLAKVQ